MRSLFSFESDESVSINSRISFPRILFSVRFAGLAFIFSKRSIIAVLLGFSHDMSPSIT